MAEVPVPRPGPGEILVRVGSSLISAGTERSVVEFAKKNLLEKALARPDLVRQVLSKLSREGVLSTLDAVRNRLGTDLALGYSNAGIVIEVGKGVTSFVVGDRVACAGGGFASHAEIVRVPRNLATKIPPARGDHPEIDFDEAAFTTVGAIALQGLRLGNPQLGETVAVIGLGLIGLLVLQLARAAGCTVIGMDPVPERCRLAEELGATCTAVNAEDLQAVIAERTFAAGADAVIIAAATRSNGPVELAGKIARDRARVIAIGAVGLEIPRQLYYEKELTFQVSRSYGAGRYDPEYEEKGRDYPIGYVRWTENRNLQAFLQLMAEGKLAVRPLITHRFPIEQAEKGYELISGKTGEPFLGVLLTYLKEPDFVRRLELPREFRPSKRSVASAVTVGLIGAGNFANATLLPAMKVVAGLELVGVCARSGVSARGAGMRGGFAYCATDEGELLRDPCINTIAITTRHQYHCEQVVAALAAGKNVFCEKPLCQSESELAEIVRAYDAKACGGDGPLIMVGYNRRFAPLAIEMAKFIRQAREPLLMHYRINAGFISPTHWTQDPEQGGGRIIGEVCHFVDFLSFLAGAPVTFVHAMALPEAGGYRDDNVTTTLQLADGSIGTIVYAANGDKSFPKERIEVFAGGRVAALDDFRALKMAHGGKQRVLKSRLRQDKGHRGEWEAWVDAIRSGGEPPIPFTQLVNTTLATFKIVEAIRARRLTAVDSDGFIARAHVGESA